MRMARFLPSGRLRMVVSVFFFAALAAKAAAEAEACKELPPSPHSAKDDSLVDEALRLLVALILVAACALAFFAWHLVDRAPAWLVKRMSAGMDHRMSSEAGLSKILRYRIDQRHVYMGSWRGEGRDAGGDVCSCLPSYPCTPRFSSTGVDMHSRPPSPPPRAPRHLHSQALQHPQLQDAVPRHPHGGTDRVWSPGAVCRRGGFHLSRVLVSNIGIQAWRPASGSSGSMSRLP